jgi:hypothetical protein
MKAPILPDKDAPASEFPAGGPIKKTNGWFFSYTAASPFVL